MALGQTLSLEFLRRLRVAKISQADWIAEARRNRKTEHARRSVGAWQAEFLYADEANEKVTPKMLA
tara:strand:+ start:55 stop:252 length:198 start_codon:yes stop_codon:yes gene_type:complete